MQFASDNSGPVHPKVMEALARANTGYAPSYGADPLMDTVREHVREVFEAPQAAVYLVATGTTANALSLASLCQPWQTIFCTDVAHIHEDECGAPEFYTSGAKLTLVPSVQGIMAADDLRAVIAATQLGGVHGVQRGPVSITQGTERGTAYTRDQIGALCDVARSYGLPVHLDGARFANALVALECSPAEITWKAGIDAVSFGGTKNGLMGVEAVVLFDPALAWEFELRRKRAGHLFSKHRYLSAQMAAYLEDGLWLDMATRANAACAALAAGLEHVDQVALHHAPVINTLYGDWPRHIHQRLHEAGAVYHVTEGVLTGDDPEERLSARLVCDWSAAPEATAEFLALFDGR
ncbi:MAG: beta-eliminating lyase-related protein [Rhodobacteraceae bacterium]|nr:beta-eliminating lyase-related protein [Paracoccaceae bacterium]